MFDEVLRADGQTAGRTEIHCIFAGRESARCNGTLSLRNGKIEAGRAIHFRRVTRLPILGVPATMPGRVASWSSPSWVTRGADTSFASWGSEVLRPSPMEFDRPLVDAAVPTASRRQSSGRSKGYKRRKGSFAWCHERPQRYTLRCRELLELRHRA
jgi:hypothetical protein